MSHGFPIPGPDLFDRLFGGPSTSQPMDEQNHRLAAENARLRAEMASREAAAYEHGLADAAGVYRENRILAATIAALTDRQHPLRVKP